MRKALNLIKEIKQIAPNSQTLIVGGAVRDYILGKAPKDIDIATNVDLSLIEAKFNTHDIGKSKDFGIVVVSFEGVDYEIANFRKDGEYTDGRRPDTVEIADTFKEDSNRRDFTINALGLDADGNIYDYHDGKKDIERCLIRTVGNPDKRFEEDALRIIRLARFSAQLGFDIEGRTFVSAIEAIDEGALSRISPERIRTEFIKVAERSDHLVSFIGLLDDLGALAILLPEIKALQGKLHNPEHHPEGDAYEHTLKAIDASLVPHPITNISILFHDVGKAVTYEFIDGNHTYRGHESAGVPIIEEIGKRLKFSTNEIEAFKFCAENHGILHRISDLKKATLARLVNNPNWKYLRAVTIADVGARGIPSEATNRIYEIRGVEKLVKELNGKTDLKNRLKEFIDGNKIIALIPEVKGNPIIGKIKAKVEDYIIENDFNVRQEDIEELILDFEG